MLPTGNKRYGSQSSEKSLAVPNSSQHSASTHLDKIMVELKENVHEGKPLPLDTKRILKKIIHDGHKFETMESDRNI
jgi:hypothetical protein